MITRPSNSVLSIFLFFLCIMVGAQEKVMTVFWDNSLSHWKSDIKKEVAFLDSILAQDQIQSVRLFLFSDTWEVADYQVAGNRQEFHAALEGIVYDGSTDFANLNGIERAGRAIVFTDGRKIDSNDFLSLDPGDMLVVNTKDADRKTLNLWALLNRIDLVDLDPKAKDKTRDAQGIFGVVYLDGKPLENIRVLGADGSEPVVTDENGRFEYFGKIGDSLRVAINQQEEVIRTIKTRDDEIQFFLDSQTVALDEVVVKDRFLERPEKIRTGYGLENKNAVGYVVSTVADEDIDDNEAKASEALYGKVPGITITKPGEDNKSTLNNVVVRGINSLEQVQFAMIVVDGVPLSNNGNVDFINTANIAEVTVLKGLAATNRYGTQGVNGVILITTKTSLGGDASGKPIDRARLTDNIFEGKLVSKKGQLNTKYLKALKKAKSVKEAYQLYLEQRGAYKEQFHYYIDVADYFRTANTRLADKVLSNIIELDLGYDALRALYLNYVHLGANQKALLTARLLTEGHPKKIQAHFDLAMTHKKAGNYQQALQLLNGMVTGTLDPGTDFSPLHKVAATELRNLVNQKKGQLDLDQVDAAYRNNLTYNARLVIDWQGASDAFVLKFVNPQNRFFDWEHSALADKQAIVNERRHGYSVEQFEIVGDMAVGQWQVYVTNLNTAQETPNWVKCTVHYNYGKPNQRSEEHLVRLDKDSDKEQLFFTFTAN
ncbi:TonB-dependent receptor plug domain-containing protein [Flagellimonas sp. DF-77]|uniref:TonB-dependent receptor plug domain-containing protein n=1 Tax=Flagellimonas algarum TaxID=3230298 RepID=UPI0033978685